MLSIGERIKKRRKELGLSVDQLAKILNKNRATVYRYESDEIENMPITVLEPLATALLTTPAYLMGWEIKLNNDNIRREIISINMENSIKRRIVNDQIYDDPSEIISNLKKMLNNNTKCIYSSEQVYVKFYNWLNGLDDMTDSEASYVSWAINDGGNIDITDDEIFYKIIDQDISYDSIIESELTIKYGTKLEIALSYECDLKKALVKKEFNTSEKIILRKKLFDIHEILKLFNEEYCFLDQYKKLIDNIRCIAINSEMRKDKTMTLSIQEIEHIKKYRLLDKLSKDIIDTLLQKEYDRNIQNCQNDKDPNE